MSDVDITAEIEKGTVEGARLITAKEVRKNKRRKGGVMAKSTLDIANAKKAKGLTRDDILIPVLAAWAHEEISIGRARELLHMPDDKIRLEAERRVSNAVKLQDERARLDAERNSLENARGELSRMIYRLLRRIPADDPLHRMASRLLDRVGVVYSSLPEDGAHCPSCGYTEQDAADLMDHRFCPNYGKAPWSELRGEKSDDI